MVNRPQLRPPNLQRHRERIDAVCHGKSASRASGSLAVRFQHRHSHRESLFFRQVILKENPVFDDGVALYDLTANLLATHLDGTAQCQPNIAHDSAVIPPVVPGMILTPLRQTGDRGCSDAIIDLNCNVVAPLQLTCDVEGIGGVSALVGSDLYTVQPNTSRIKRRPEMKLDVQIWGSHGHLKGLEIPCLAKVAILTAHIPGVRNAHRVSVEGRMLLPVGALSDLVRICAKQPIAIQINP